MKIPKAATIKSTAREWGFQKNTLTTTLRKMQTLNEYVFFKGKINIKELVKPGQLTVLDLSGNIDEKARRTITAVILEKAFNARRSNEIPPLTVVIEESHRFAPQGTKSYCNSTLLLNRKD